MKIFLGGMIFFTLLPFLVGAYYTNDNLGTIAHSKPVWFLTDGNGGFYGATEDGTAFTQKPITNDLGIRLHKFQIDSAFFYVSDRGVIYAENNLMALSMYLALM